MSQPTLSDAHETTAQAPAQKVAARPQAIMVKAVNRDHVPARHMAEAVGYRAYLRDGTSLRAAEETVYEKFNVAMRATKEYAKENGYRVVGTPTIPVNGNGLPVGGAHRRR